MREAIAALPRSGLAPLELMHEAARTVSRVVPFDAASLVTMDPGTRLPTAHVAVGGPREIFGSLVANEIRTPDVNKFIEFGSGPVPVATLGSLSPAATERSPRVRQVLRPYGLRDELRVVFRAGGRWWGAASLMRGHDLSYFTACERTFIAEVAADVGRALREIVARHPAAEPEDEETAGPGVVVVDDGLTVLSTTQEAELWRARAADDLAPALATSTLVALAHPDGIATGRIRLAERGWLTLRAARLYGESGRVAVTLQPARYTDVTALLMHVRRLSVIERSVTELHLRGLSEAAICTRLGISPAALREHLLSVFAKVGVAGPV